MDPSWGPCNEVVGKRETLMNGHEHFQVISLQERTLLQCRKTTVQKIQATATIVASLQSRTTISAWFRSRNGTQKRSFKYHVLSNVEVVLRIAAQE